MLCYSNEVCRTVRSQILRICRNHNWRVMIIGGAICTQLSQQVVLAVSDNGMKVGADVANATVEASVVKEGRAKKVIVYKYKRKTGYHKKNGHRQAFTQVKIEKINA